MRARFETSGAIFVRSPWYGVLEIVGEPGAACWWGTECWNGESCGFYVTETLRPLSPAAATMLGVRWGDRVWDDRRKRAWTNEPIRLPFCVELES